MKKMNKIFEVVIDKTTYPVFSIPNKEHQALNGGPNTWWLYFMENEDVLSGKTMPAVDGEYWVPYESSVIPRILWRVEYEQECGVKIKWNDPHFRKGGVCKMYANGKLVYEFRSRDLNYALSRAQVLQVELTEHPYNFLEPETMKGRKIWFRGLPATVEPSEYHPGEIIIVPDLELATADAWWEAYFEQALVGVSDEDREIESMEETRRYGKINWGDALSDGLINWFRN